MERTVFSSQRKGCSTNERGTAAFSRDLFPKGSRVKQTANKVVHCPNRRVEHGNSGCHNYSRFENALNSYNNE
ncbi:UNKNOWN [Stylonychia lemnae]|uniref:Uncharacterized protein n=1 Tax=Stylonychia lemnae TaxID=5949 RepID=A0A078AER1_STYLE|nr:UNKNOWN [Stylonychia lemnae]|eukprot:CDW79373.1 UNKNOWN [Stylonychia lemnae]